MRTGREPINYSLAYFNHPEIVLTGIMTIGYKQYQPSEMSGLIRGNLSHVPLKMYTPPPL